MSTESTDNIRQTPWESVTQSPLRGVVATAEPPLQVAQNTTGEDTTWLDWIGRALGWSDPAPETRTQPEQAAPPAVRLPSAVPERATRPSVPPPAALPDGPSKWDTLKPGRFAEPEPGAVHNFSWDRLPDLLNRLRVPPYPPPEYKKYFDDMMSSQLAGIKMMMEQFGTGDLSRPAKRTDAEPQSPRPSTQGRGEAADSQRQATEQADSDRARLQDSYRQAWCKFSDFDAEWRQKRQKALDVTARLVLILEQSVLSRGPQSEEWARWRRDAVQNVYDHTASTNRQLASLMDNMYRCGVVQGEAVRKLIEDNTPRGRRTRCEKPGFEVIPRKDDPSRFSLTTTC